MSYYVYKYVHPDYPWLYVGLTENLPTRIYTHNNNSEDNIDRKWQKQLDESTVYYHECSDEQDMKVTEKYLINTFKPILNKADKSDKKSSIPQVDIGWTLYDPTTFKDDNILDSADWKINFVLPFTEAILEYYKNNLLRMHCWSGYYESVPIDLGFLSFADAIKMSDFLVYCGFCIDEESDKKVELIDYVAPSLDSNDIFIIEFNKIPKKYRFDNIKPMRSYIKFSSSKIAKMEYGYLIRQENNVEIIKIKKLYDSLISSFNGIENKT